MGAKEFFKKRSLRVRDDTTTKAAELSLRESIYPICLVTVYVSPGSPCIPGRG